MIGIRLKVAFKKATKRYKYGKKSLNSRKSDKPVGFFRKNKPFCYCVGCTLHKRRTAELRKWKAPKIDEEW